VIDFIQQTDDASLAVSNLSLVLVDTPGFFDDSGTNQDNENMKAIKEYKNKRLGNYYPNLIMISVQVNEIALVLLETKFEI
jgi:hypothetical protein